VNEFSELEEVPEFLPDEINKVTLYARLIHVLETALKLNIFDFLKKPASIEELAKHTGVEVELLEKLCNVLVAIGLLKERNSSYENTIIANTYLVSNSPYTIKHLLSSYVQSLRSKWSRLSEAILNAPLKNVDKSSPEEFTLAMAESAMCGELQKTLDILKRVEDFKKASKLLDLGGGHGLYAIAFARAFPNLHVYILDFPHVIEIAKKITSKYIERYKLQERVHFIAADFTKDNIGSNYDIIFASHVFYSKTELLPDILRKIYMALNSNGLFISKHTYINETRDGPLRALLFELQLSAFHYGSKYRLFTLREFISQLTRIGFVIEHVEDVLESKLVIARKSIRS